MIDFEAAQYGSAEFADARTRRKAGLGAQHGAYIGHDAAGRVCLSDQMSAILLCGGARSLKGSVVIPWLVDGKIAGSDGPQHIVTLDWKGQDSVIARQQVKHGRHVYAFNPRRKPLMPFHRFHALSHLTPDSPTLIADTLETAASWIPVTDAKSAYFQQNAQWIFTGITVVLVRRFGFVTLPMIADTLADLGDATDAWLEIEFEISIQLEYQISSIATKLQSLRNRADEGGGWEGIKGEIRKSFLCLMDAQLREALSPPFDFDFAQLVDPSSPPCLVSIMEDLEFATVSGPVVRALYTSALIWKRRHLQARKQFWVLQEIGNMGAWPLAQDLATISAGYGIRTAYVVQSTRQLENLKKGASDVILASCGTHIFLGTRSVEQADLIRRSLGRMTLKSEDQAAIARAQAARSKAAHVMLFGGGDVTQALVDAKLQDQLAKHPKRMGRDLRGIDEILGEDNGKAFVFMPGVLPKPAYLTIRPYWQRRDLAGLYMGDPFHNAPNTVEIATRWGQRLRKEISEPVPIRYLEWPQYRGQYSWSYVEGYRP